MQLFRAPFWSRSECYVNWKGSRSLERDVGSWKTKHGLAKLLIDSSIPIDRLSYRKPAHSESSQYTAREHSNTNQGGTPMYKSTQIYGFCVHTKILKIDAACVGWIDVGTISWHYLLYAVCCYLLWNLCSLARIITLLKSRETVTLQIKQIYYIMKLLITMLLLATASFVRADDNDSCYDWAEAGECTTSKC